MHLFVAVSSFHEKEEKERKKEKRALRVIW